MSSWSAVFFLYYSIIILDYSWQQISMLNAQTKYIFDLGSGCGTVDWVVASFTWLPRFNPQWSVNLIIYLSPENFKSMKVKRLRKRAREWSLKNIFFSLKNICTHWVLNIFFFVNLSFPYWADIKTYTTFIYVTYSMYFFFSLCLTLLSPSISFSAP